MNDSALTTRANLKSTRPSFQPRPLSIQSTPRHHSQRVKSQVGTATTPNLVPVAQSSRDLCLELVTTNELGHHEITKIRQFCLAMDFAIWYRPRS